MFCFHCIKQSCSFLQLLPNLIIANFRDEREEGGCSSRRKRIGGEFAKMPLFFLNNLFQFPLIFVHWICIVWPVTDSWSCNNSGLSPGVACYRQTTAIASCFRCFWHKNFVAGWNQGCHQRPRAWGAEVPWTRAFPGEQDDLKNHSKLCTNFCFQSGTWCGVELDSQLGRHSGRVGGTNYFHCRWKDCHCRKEFFPLAMKLSSRNFPQGPARYLCSHLESREGVFWVSFSNMLLILIIWISLSNFGKSCGFSLRIWVVFWWHRMSSPFKILFLHSLQTHAVSKW